MSFLDRFKRSPKKEPMKDDSLFSPELQKKRYEAALEFVKIFQEKIPLVGGKPHAGTVLSVAARLAGSSLYRSLNYQKDVDPGVVVLSNEVNEAWPQLMNLFAFYCKQNGIDVMSKPPLTQFPEQDKPRMEVEQVLAEYQDQYHEIMKKHGLDYLNGARAGMVVCSVIFQYHCMNIKDIDPYVATGIVAMGVVEGAKTAPPSLKSERTPAAGSALQKDQVAEILRGVVTSSVNGSGTRLVLGDGADAMQDAVANGGKYVLVHPAVAAQLQQKNINPYYVYETAMRIEIKLKISRIDFVKADVDKLYEEWRTKSQAQAPIHVRLIIWLKNNAATYGYEQSGNSWILKQ